MALLETYGYSIYMKTGYKILHIIFAIVSMIVVVATALMAMEKGETIQVYIIRVLLVLLFIVLSFAEIMLVRKKVHIHKGKVMYYNGFKNKEYKLSEIYRTNTEVESYVAVSSGGMSTRSYDHVTTFYDHSGNKLFKFGSAFTNIERLEKDVTKAQKSIVNNKKKKTK